MIKQRREQGRNQRKEMRLKHDEKQGGTITVGTAAKLLKITETRVRQLAELGYIQRAGRGQYNLVNVVHGYIDFLKDEERRASKTASFARMQDARTAKIEMELAAKRRELVPLEEVHFFLETTFGRLKSRLLGVPARVSRDMATRSAVEKEIHAALNETAAKLAEAGRASSAPLPAEDETEE